MRLRLTRPFQSGQRVRSSAFRPQFETLEDRCVPTTLPAGFAEVNVAGGLAMPTAMQQPPDYSARVFITTQGGQVRVYDAVTATLLPTPFLTVPTTTWFERGLQNITFDPDFVNNGYVYIYYTENVPQGANTFNRVTRWTVDPNNPNRALPGSEQLIIRLDQVMAGNHNGGGLRFGDDGYLYITTGENARSQLAQSTTSNLGKVLRIDPYRDDFPGDPNRNFGVPAGNPFPNGSRPEIYSLGFRNPFHMAVHPYSGMVYVNDVGSAGNARREEINSLYEENGDNVAAGANFGWPNREGIVGDPLYWDPVFAYNPQFGGSPANCSIVGGDFYAYYDEASGFPAAYQDSYFFADYCGRWIYNFNPYTGNVAPFATSTAAQAIDVMVDNVGGYMYYLTRGTGAATGTLTLVYYAGAGPSPGSGSGDIVDILTPITPITPVAPLTTPQALAVQPQSRGVDQFFARPISQEPTLITPLAASEAAVDHDLWSSIF